VILDLSAVTDGLINVVKNAWASAPIWAELGLSGPSFTPTFTGLAPDAVRNASGPQLSLFLYHAELNNAQEATFWTSQMQNGGEPPSAYMPLALNLYYLMFGYSEGSYPEEQQAMSVAMRVFHATPTISSDTTATPAWTLTMTIERRSYDELSLLWQATTSPLRLGLVYRAAVMFLAPDPPPASPTAVATLDATFDVTGASTPAAADVLTLTAADAQAAGIQPPTSPAA